MTGKKSIHQLVHTLSYGDAISSEVLALQRVLSEHGVDSHIYAINVHPKYKGRAEDYRNFPKQFLGEVVLHYSLGSPLNGLYRGLSEAKRTLIYHNITPSKWFRGVNPRVARDIENGINDLGEVCRTSTRCLADSSYNAKELQQFGVEAKILSLPVDTDRWDEQANAGILAMLKNDPSLHLLHVGRIVPNKKLEDIIKVFYFLKNYVHKQSKLWFVGIDTDAELYSFALKRMITEFGLDDSVTFTGGLADSEVRAFYEGASVYMCMSEHEGFCLPVAEAMNFGLPVVSFSAGALTETIANGGILVDQKRPAELAELVSLIHQDVGLKKQLVAAGKNRIAEMSYSKFEQSALKLFEIS